MALAAEIVGFIVLSIALHRIAGASAPTTAASGATLIMIVSGLAFWSGLWPTIVSLTHAHSANAKLSLEQSNAEGGIPFGVSEGFMAFADKTIPRQDRVFIECGQHEVTCGSEADWFGFRLLPRVFVTNPRRAQWAIFYNAAAANEPFAKGWTIKPFAPGFALARAPR